MCEKDPTTFLQDCFQTIPGPSSNRAGIRRVSILPPSRSWTSFRSKSAPNHAHGIEFSSGPPPCRVRLLLACKKPVAPWHAPVHTIQGDSQKPLKHCLRFAFSCSSTQAGSRTSSGIVSDPSDGTGPQPVADALVPPSPTLVIDLKCKRRLTCRQAQSQPPKSQQHQELSTRNANISFQ
jgi:hypothetical protein